MLKKAILTIVSLLFLSAFIFFTTAQTLQTGSEIHPPIEREILTKGSNFETYCINGLCNTTIYSYDKYFNRDGNWEEIDESWSQCEEGFCTNNYYFKAIANSNGLIRIESENGQLSQTITGFMGRNLTFSTPLIEGSVLTYEDIIPNVDLRYQYLSHRLKEEFVINQPIEILSEGDLVLDFSLDGDLDYSLDRPFICDSGRNCISLGYQADSDEASITIPRDFLLNNDLVYPLVIDPSYGVGPLGIIWNGYIEDLGGGHYNRINNPSKFILGDNPSGISYGDIDWNLENFPNIGRIDYVYLALFIEDFTAPNELNIVDISPENSSTYLDDSDGNAKLFELIGTGPVYSTAFSPIPLSNFTYYFIFDSNGVTEVRSALSSDKRFSTGLSSYTNENMFISARDHPTPAQRPFLILQHSPEEHNLTYDANGNMVQGFGKYLEYDAWNRLSRVRNSSSTGKILAEYFYDHESNRIKKIVYGVNAQGHNESTYYMNTRPADFIQVVNTNGTIINETYIYLQDKLIAKIDTKGKKFFYHPDHLGSTSLVTNESGAVVEDLLYLPYGEVLIGDEISRYGYTGQENDLESGFIDYGARQYHPQFARFLQPDPIIADVYDPQNLNRYAYVLNNPYKYTDPTGNFVVEAIITSAVVGAFIGGVTTALKPDSNWVDVVDSTIIGLEAGAFAPIGILAGTVATKSPKGGVVGGAYAAALAGELTSNYLEGEGFGITDPQNLGQETAKNYIQDRFGFLFGDIDPFGNNNEESTSDFISSQIKPGDDEYTTYQNQPTYKSPPTQDDGGRRGGIFQTPSGSNPGGGSGSGSSGGSSGSGGSGGSGCGFTTTCGGGCGSFMSCI